MRPKPMRCTPNLSRRRTLCSSPRLIKCHPTLHVQKHNCGHSHYPAVHRRQIVLAFHRCTYHVAPCSPLATGHLGGICTTACFRVKSCWCFEYKTNASPSSPDIVASLWISSLLHWYRLDSVVGTSDALICILQVEQSHVMSADQLVRLRFSIPRRIWLSIAVVQPGAALALPIGRVFPTT
jgi:hypothetical protein